MNKENVLDILKNAILFEMRGKAFYEQSAKNSQSPSAKKIFEIMAKEEESHVELLKKQFTELQSNGSYDPGLISSAKENFAEEIMNENFKKEVSAAGYEAAAISAAMAMEQQAVNFYSSRAKNSDTPHEKDFYNALADWEKTHLNFLSELDTALREEVWYDNNFWPF